MINLFIFIAGILLFTFLFGRIMEKIRIPWVFAGLILGTVASLITGLSIFSKSDIFIFIANFGMYLLLFIIGMEINMKKINRSRGFIVKATFFIISFEAIFGGIIFHYVFDYSWLISLLVGFSFATVGEAVLIPILDEFKMVNTKIGQAILGVGTLDDIIEILLLILLVGVVGTRSGYTGFSIILFSLLVLLGLTSLFYFIGKFKKKFKFRSTNIVFLLTMSIFFLFLGIGEFSGSTAFAAFLAGISVKKFIPKKEINIVKNKIRTLTYGIFAPLFFFLVGISMDLNVLLLYPLLLFLVLVVSLFAKLFATLIISRGYFSLKKSIALGIGLSVRFSTSIIIVKILFDSGLINNRLYSILIASSFLLTLLVPIVFSKLVIKWNLNKNERT